MKLQKNNGDTINADNIWWKVGKERTDSTLTKEINVANNNITVDVYGKNKNKKGEKDGELIAHIEFIVSKSPYVTFSPFPKYNGEFGFDDGENLINNSVPKQNNQYETIHIMDKNAKTKILYVPWLTLLQGQTDSLQVKVSEEIEGDSIYATSSTQSIRNNYIREKNNNRLIITNGDLMNLFTNPEYIHFYRTDKYKLQEDMLIGKLAVVGRPWFQNEVDIQIIYFVSDSIRFKNPINMDRLRTLLNSNSLNQAFVHFNVLPNIIYMRDTIGSTNRTKLNLALGAILREFQKRKIIFTNVQPLTTVYIMMTELQFTASENNDETIERGGGVMDNYNLVIMWLLNNAKEDKEKMIIHEIGHTLGLKDVFKDVELGGHDKNPTPTSNKNWTKSNYMDYYIQRKMFFKTQINTILDNFSNK
jgi:hypothetical protein